MCTLCLAVLEGQDFKDRARLCSSTQEADTGCYLDKASVTMTGLILSTRVMGKHWAPEPMLLADSIDCTA